MRVAVVGHVEWVEFVGVEHLPRAGEVVDATARSLGPRGVEGSLAVLADLGAEVDFFCPLGRDAGGRYA